VSRGYSEYSVDLQRACRCQDEEDIQFAVGLLKGMRGEVGLKPKVVYWLYVAIVRLTISFASLVWWPGCQTASATKRLRKVQRSACLGITSDFYDTYQCYGGTYWSPSAGSTDTGVGKVGGTSPLEFGVLVLPSPQSRTELHTDATSEV
jgi:hypothetical protein